MLALYVHTWTYGWAYEDFNDPERFMAIPTFANVFERWPRVVTKATFGLSGLISPMAPYGYHVVSVLLHALNAVLVFCLARSVAPEWPAFAAAVLFAVHPLQTEAVAYISARADVVMATCVLFALVAAGKQCWAWMCAWCVLAVLAKESGIVAFPLAVLWAWWRDRLPTRVLVYGGAVSGLAALGVWLFYGLPGLDRAYTSLEVAKAWFLLSKVWIPVGFSIDHDYAAWQSSLWPATPMIATVLVVGWALVSRPKAWAFGVLFVAIALAPRLLVPLVEGLHEHHLYLSLAGISLAIVKGLHGISASPA